MVANIWWLIYTINHDKNQHTRQRDCTPDRFPFNMYVNRLRIQVPPTLQAVVDVIGEPYALVESYFQVERNQTATIGAD